MKSRRNDRSLSLSASWRPLVGRRREAAGFEVCSRLEAVEPFSSTAVWDCFFFGLPTAAPGANNLTLLALGDGPTDFFSRTRQRFAGMAWLLQR